MSIALHVLFGLLGFGLLLVLFKLVLAVVRPNLRRRLRAALAGCLVAGRATAMGIAARSATAPSTRRRPPMA